MKKRILVTGGAGYIGSHMVRMLLERGHGVVIFDDLSTGRRELVQKKAVFVRGDLCDAGDVKHLFSRHRFDAVMHFAASIVVPESVADPVKYYENNVYGTLNLLREMTARGASRFVFSSTGATYGEPKRVPVREDDPQWPTNPYGMSKLMVERILKDLAAARPDFRYVVLRYFNVCGAHPGGDLGPMKKKETLLIPNVLRAVREGAAHPLNIFGTDYPTPDGTCIRDYVHVMDLCSAHLLAMRYLEKGGRSDVFNLGNGKGYSVKQVIDATERLLKTKVPVKFSPRRPGDPSRIIASTTKARRVLRWKPTYDLPSILDTAWRWDRAKAALAAR